MSGQHRSRRLVLQALCCIDAQGTGAWDLLEEFISDSHENSFIVNAAKRMLREVFDTRPKCDELLARHARRWELPRLALVDRNILRLACYELCKGETPFKVVISESLKLAREFSTAESARFVNGVIDAVARELQAEKNKQTPPNSEKNAD
jgi:N utilization substance protein B